MALQKIHRALIGQLDVGADQIQDGTITWRDLAELPLKTVTRDPVSGLITQIIHEGVIEGKTITDVEDITRDPVTGLVSQITFTETIDGANPVSKTETYQRDASGRISGS